MDAAGEVLVSWALSPEVATVRGGPLQTNSDAPTALQLVYEGQPDEPAAIYEVSVTQAR